MSSGVCINRFSVEVNGSVLRDDSGKVVLFATVEDNESDKLSIEQVDCQSCPSNQCNDSLYFN